MRGTGASLPPPTYTPSLLRFSLVNDSEGWLCIQKVSGQVHTARSLQGAQPGGSYTVLVVAQDAGGPREMWGLQAGSVTLRLGSRTELPPWDCGTAWDYHTPGRNKGLGLNPSWAGLASASFLWPPSQLSPLALKWHDRSGGRGRGRFGVPEGTDGLAAVQVVKRRGWHRVTMGWKVGGKGSGGPARWCSPCPHPDPQRNQG